MPVRAEIPQVVVSIKPIHSLVAGVMQQVGTPELLLSGGQSPHIFNLRPSDVRKLGNADIIFWIGENLETPLTHAIAANADQAEIVELMEQAELMRLPVREGGIWSAHTDHNEIETADSHHHGVDHHIWLSPHNAGQLVIKVTEILSHIDPEHAQTYQKNARNIMKRLTRLDQELRQKTTPVTDIPYIVFHDAYQYFEHHYALNGVGSVTVSPDETPGARRILTLRKKINQLGAHCVFSEPQFEPRLVYTLLEGSPARAGILDPIGLEIPAGPDFYFELMRNLAEDLVRCLSDYPQTNHSTLSTQYR